MVSDPFYTNSSAAEQNPTNGSWWFLQILSIGLSRQNVALEKGSEQSTHFRGMDFGIVFWRLLVEKI
jgi:hypothetical protein